MCIIYDWDHYCCKKSCAVVEECAIFYSLPFTYLFNSHFPAKAVLASCTLILSLQSSLPLEDRPQLFAVGQFCCPRGTSVMSIPIYINCHPLLDPGFWSRSFACPMRSLSPNQQHQSTVAIYKLKLCHKVNRGKSAMQNLVCGSMCQTNFIIF